MEFEEVIVESEAVPQFRALRQQTYLMPLDSGYTPLPILYETAGGLPPLWVELYRTAGQWSFDGGPAEQQYIPFVSTRTKAGVATSVPSAFTLNAMQFVDPSSASDGNQHVWPISSVTPVNYQDMIIFFNHLCGAVDSKPATIPGGKVVVDNHSLYEVQLPAASVNSNGTVSFAWVQIAANFMPALPRDFFLQEGGIWS